MQVSIQATPASNKGIWTGRIITGIAVLFLAMDGVMKLGNPQPVVEAMSKLGYPTSLSLAIGLLELACLAIYLIPRTAALGAVLMTGYLGGAVATHVRAGSDLFSLIFPLIIGAMLWGGLLLRDERLREIFIKRA